MIKAIIFDFDGVIVDSFDVVWHVFQDVIKHHELDVDEEGFRRLFDINFYKGLESLGIKPGQKKEIKKRIWGHRNFETDLFNPFPGIVDAIRKLDGNIRMAIVSSNKTSIIKKILKREGILKYFSKVLGGDVSESKVEKMHACIKDMKLKKSEVIYIGDTVGDLKEAKKEGLNIGAATWGFHNKKDLMKQKPDYVFDKPKDLLKLIK